MKLPPVQPFSPARCPRSIALSPGALGSGPGRPLSAPLLRQSEAALGGDFADVRVHVGPHVSAAGARAFTCGPQIHFAPGQFQPTTAQGRMLIAHELAHVVQQRAGRVRNPFGHGLAMVQDPGLEAEAQRLARTAVRPQAAPRSRPAEPAAVAVHKPPSVLQAMLFEDLVVGQYYLVAGTSRELEGKENGWLKFEGLPTRVRAKHVTGPAPKPGAAPKRKFEALSDYPFRADAYSDSEDDMESDFEDLLGEEYEHPQAQKGGTKKKKVKLMNATKWHPQEDVREMGVDNAVRDPSELPSLEEDAKAIQTAAELSSRAAAFTVVCALAQTKERALKKFCFSNLESALYPKSREKAHELGYHVIFTNQAHAEAEMMAYLKSRGYELVSMGVDKPHCPECNKLVHDVLEGDFPTETRVETDRAKPFANYYMPPLAAHAWKQTTYARSDEHRPSKEPDFSMTDDFSRDPDLGSAMDFVMAASSVNRTYYSDPKSKKKNKKAP